jgi:hypothetical protein
MKNIIYILPSEAQEAIFYFGLKEKYFSTDFTKYRVSDFGVDKFKRLLHKNKKFQNKLLKRKVRKYARESGKERWVNRIVQEDSYVFYDETEVMDWIYIHTN